ncbi:flotillin-like FloA family protein, partial [Bacteroides heparinolyticus]|uniref:flotillin-like FloA family protein n=1 Tax=Prevotella heparinolytica TaxID=28113 RepID=UPI00359F6207
AMAEAFRSGNLGIMDYYRMKNIEADTSMRENIAKPARGRLPGLLCLPAIPALRADGRLNHLH